jgi:polyisoprenoid-binding protein YceI
MNRSTLASLFVTGALAFAACKDPSAGVTHAATRAASHGPGAAPLAGAEHLAVSSATSRVQFVGSKVTATHEGQFTQFTGSIDLSPEHVEASRIHIDIDMNAFTIDPARLATHLRSPDFFDVARFPQATFESTEIRAGGSGAATHTITGNLTLHGQTRSITFPATVRVTPAEVVAQSEFSINRRDFGIVYPGMANDLIRDNVVIRLDIHAPRAAR